MNMGDGEVVVPPGFRFHPTDEELVYYYLRKKVSYESIDLDVIREVDLNKLEPWDLKDKCRIGSGPQNDWYFFSHKDKKYPTGTRTNRATTAGFWKATGRDKVIHHTTNNKRIGMRKTLVFYTGRAPHGHKTDWIMHEYRLEDDNSHLQEDGWVVCRVFKKNHYSNKGFQTTEADQYDLHQHQHQHQHQQQQQHVFEHHQPPPIINHLQPVYDYGFDGSSSSMHLPHLFSPESAAAAAAGTSFLSPAVQLSLNNVDVECSHNLLRLTTPSNNEQHQDTNRFNATDWSFLDKLLASHHHHSADLHPHPHPHPHLHPHQQAKCNNNNASSSLHNDVNCTTAHKFPFHYLGGELDILK